MAFPKHYLFAFGGSLCSQETWTCTMRMWAPGLATMAAGDMDVYAAANVDAVAVRLGNYWHTAANNPTNPLSNLRWAKFNAIKADGKYVGDQTHEHFWTVPVVKPSGDTTDAYAPSEVALALTLDTGVNRGLAHAGRVYLPAQLGGLADTGTVAPATQRQWCDWGANLVKAVNSWTGTPTPTTPLVSVVSRGRAVGGQYSDDGTARLVTSVRLGRVYDVQRRRRSSLDEAYLTATV